jgi:hypothetical protein
MRFEPTFQSFEKKEMTTTINLILMGFEPLSTESDAYLSQTSKQSHTKAIIENSHKFPKIENLSKPFNSSILKN